MEGLNVRKLVTPVFLVESVDDFRDWVGGFFFRLLLQGFIVCLYLPDAWLVKPTDVGAETSVTRYVRL